MKWIEGFSGLIPMAILLALLWVYFVFRTSVQPAQRSSKELKRLRAQIDTLEERVGELEKRIARGGG